MKILFTLFIFSFTVLFPQKNISGMTSCSEKKWWINFGVGNCNLQQKTRSGADYYGWSSGFNYLQKNKLFSFRMTRNKEFNFFRNPRETLNETALLYGFYFPGNNKYASISAGVAFIDGVRRGEFLYVPNKANTFLYYSTKHCCSVGIPLELQLYMTHSGFVGFGFTAYGNLNTEKSFAGLLFSLQLGKLH